jgi:TRAP-type C4-dicarboxylate transport system permease small subunit
MHMHPRAESESSHGAISGVVARLEILAEILAIGAGVALVLLAVVNVANIISLIGLGSSLLGVGEIAELIMGIVVFAFFPYTQVKSAHISVELLNFVIGPRWRNFLDVLHNVVFSVVIAVLTWRVMAGGYDAWLHRETSMMLGLPIWIGFLGASIGSVVFTATCIASVMTKAVGGSK